MSYRKDRDEFVGVIVAEVVERRSQRPVPLGSSGRAGDEGTALARLILRNAATIQRCETDACNGGPAYDQDRVECPESGNASFSVCPCRDSGSYDNARHQHGTVPRAQAAILRARQRIEAACKPWGIVPTFSGDPRGACVKLVLPSGRWNSAGGAEDGYCVPTR